MVTPTAAALDAGTIENTASVASDTPDSFPADNESGVEVDVVEPPAIIDNDVIQLGVNKEGHLIVPGDEPSSEGEDDIGLRYLPTNAESTAPGCSCEGWGVADASSGVTGFANIDSDGGANNMTVDSFAHDGSTANSVVEVGSTFKVTHDFHPAPDTPNLYEVDVTIENISDEPVDDVRYRRVMDWDVEPTAFDEFVTIEGSDSFNVRYASDDGFASANPLAGESLIDFEGDATDSGPNDHGALFDFEFGQLAPGNETKFEIFYGAAGNEDDAESAVSAVESDVHSFGQPSAEDGPTLGTPNTFIFAFDQVDERPPRPALDLDAESDSGSSDGITNDPTPTINGTAGPNSTIEVFEGDTSLGTTTSDVDGNWSFTVAPEDALPDGDYDITAEATNEAGFTSPPSEPLTLTIDTEAPAPNITDGPTGTIEVNSATFEFSSESGATLACKLNDGDFEACESPKTYENLDNRLHTFTVRATDVADNSGTTSRDFTVDAQPPDAPTISLDAGSNSGSKDDNITNDATPTFSGTAEANSTVELFDGASSLGTATANGSDEWSFTVETALEDGPHSITATAANDSGESDPSSPSLSITIDTVPPNVEITTGPTGTVNQKSATLEFSSDENDAALACKLDDEEFSACAGSKSYENLSGAAHTFTVQATDTADNSATDSRTWTVDTTPPAVPTVSLDADSNSGSKDDNTTNDNTPTFNGTAEPGSIVELSKNGEALGEAEMEEDGSWTFTATATFSDGTSRITATATDAAGNVSEPSGELTIIIDTEAPVAQITDGPEGSTKEKNVSFEFSSETDTTFACLLTGEQAASSCTSPKSYENLPDGAYTFTVGATDIAGNSGSASRDFSVDATSPAAPTLSLDSGSNSGSKDDNITSDTTPTFNGTAEANSTVEVFDGTESLGTAPTDGNGAWSLTATATFSDGTSHDITARATDATGNESDASAPLTIVIDATAPSVSVTSGPPEFDAEDPDSPTASSSSATLAFSSENGSTIRCKLDSVNEDGSTVAGTFAACSSPASFDGLANGVHTFTARATDVAGNVREDVYVWKVAPDVVEDTIADPNGGTVISGDEPPTESNPVNTEIQIPGPGNVSIVETPVVDEPPPGLSFLGQQVEVSIPQATAENPISLTFFIHPSLIPGGEDEFDSVLTLLNGERIRNCTVVAQAVPDPCVKERTLQNGLIKVTVLTSGQTPQANAQLSAQAEQAPFTFNFAVDNEAPGAPTITTPANNATLDSSTVAFSGAAEPGSTVKVFEGASFDTSPSKGQATAADGDGAWSVAIPNVPDGSHTYNATATDESGNESAPSLRTFTVNTAPPPPPPDTTKPRISTFGPVGVNKPPTVNSFVVFNERVNRATVKASSFKLTGTVVKKVRGKNKRITVNVPATVAYNDATRTATLNPSRNLAPGAAYKATVNTQVRDLAGNQLAAGKTWTFKVKPKPKKKRR